MVEGSQVGGLGQTTPMGPLTIAVTDFLVFDKAVKDLAVDFA